MAAREVFGNRRIAIFMSDSFLRTPRVAPLPALIAVVAPYPP